MKISPDRKGRCGMYLFLAMMLLFVCPAKANAHLVSTGFGPFYDGIIHLALSPEDLMAVIALALLSGLIGPQYGRIVLFMLPSAWLIGGFLGMEIIGRISLPDVSMLSLIVVGILVAVDRKLPLWLVSIIAVAIGLLHGVLNGSAMVQVGGEFLSLVRIAASVFVLVSIGAACIVLFNATWARMVVRVAGSWIAAIGLLMLGWAFRK
jgi:urease accessory protein